MINKSAQGMSTSTIVLLILGLIILVVLVLGFTLGWNKLAPWVQSNNLDSIKTACNIACTTNSQYDFCSATRTVNDGVNKKFEDNCNGLATNATYTSRAYGIPSCPSITCP